MEVEDLFFILYMHIFLWTTQKLSWCVCVYLCIEWKSTLHDSRTRLHSPQPTFASWGFPFSSCGHIKKLVARSTRSSVSFSSFSFPETFYISWMINFYCFSGSNGFVLEVHMCLFIISLLLFYFSAVRGWILCLFLAYCSAHLCITYFIYLLITFDHLVC